MGGHLSRLRDFETYLYVDRKKDRSNEKQNRLNAVRLLSFYETAGQTRESLNRFVENLQSLGLRNGTLNNFISLAKHYDKFTKKNILGDLKYFRQEPFHTERLTATEIKMLAECARPYQRRAKYLKHLFRVLIYFLALTGCRINEALSLEKKDIADKSVIFRDTKNGESRQVPIPEWLVKDIFKTDPDNPLAFPSSHGTKMTDGNMRIELQKRAEITGIKKPCYPHVFRHSFVTEMIRSKVPIMYIARIVGHRDLQSTNRYTHLVLDDLREAQMQHPLLRESQTFADIVARLKKQVEAVIDITKCRVSVSQTANLLAIRVEKA